MIESKEEKKNTHSGLYTPLKEKHNLKINRLTTKRQSWQQLVCAAERVGERAVRRRGQFGMTPKKINKMQSADIWWCLAVTTATRWKKNNNCVYCMSHDDNTTLACICDLLYIS